MPDKADEIIEAMNRLAAKASELAHEHTRIMREFRELKQELDALRQDQSAKSKS